MSEKRLLNAVKNGHINWVKRCLSRDVSANLIDDDGLSLLMIAADQGNLSIMQLLIDHGADVNYASKGEICYDWTPIFHCLGREEALELLLKNGANPDHQLSFNGKTFLHRCAIYSCDCIHLANILLRYNADLRLMDQSGKSALDELMDDEYHNERMLELFMAHIENRRLDSIIETFQPIDSIYF